MLCWFHVELLGMEQYLLPRDHMTYKFAQAADSNLDHMLPRDHMPSDHMCCLGITCLVITCVA